MVLSISYRKSLLKDVLYVSASALDGSSRLFTYEYPNQPHKTNNLVSQAYRKQTFGLITKHKI